MVMCKNRILTKEQVQEKIEKCKLIQLSKVAPANEMYGSSYGYWTSLSPLMIKHMQKKSE